LVDAQADVLEIFDCCYAGVLADQSRGGETRRFEVLAACASDATTRKPGPRSFTRALIWALGGLKESRGRFTTSDLINQVKMAPNFPKETQNPVMSKRGGPTSTELIILRPLTFNDLEDSFSNVCPARSGPSAAHSILDLKFFLQSNPDNEQIIGLGEQLLEVVKKNEIKVNHIMWGGIYATQPTNPVAPAVLLAASRFTRLLAPKQNHTSTLDGRKTIHVSEDELHETVKDALHEELDDHIRARSILWHMRTAATILLEKSWSSLEDTFYSFSGLL